jgi:hypothetical protein
VKVIASSGCCIVSLRLKHVAADYDGGGDADGYDDACSMAVVIGSCMSWHVLQSAVRQATGHSSLRMAVQ